MEKIVLIAKSLIKVSGKLPHYVFLIKLYKVSAVDTIEKVEDVKIVDWEVVRSLCYRDEGDLSVLPDYLVLIIDKVHESIVATTIGIKPLLK